MFICVHRLVFYSFYLVDAIETTNRINLVGSTLRQMKMKTITFYWMNILRLRRIRLINVRVYGTPVFDWILNDRYSHCCVAYTCIEHDLLYQCDTAARRIEEEKKCWKIMPSIILRLCDIQNHSEQFRIGLDSESTMQTTPDITQDGTKIVICGHSRTIIYYLHE